MDKIIDKAKTMYNKRTQCHLGADAYILLARYLQKCCNVSWLMLLQKPRLSLQPKEFKPPLKSVAFNGSLHKKTMGSDRKSSYVLYHVWPSIKRGNESLQIQTQVIVRDNEVPMKRKW